MAEVEPAQPPATRPPPNVTVTSELTDRMGIEIVDWAPERLVGTMPVEGNRQPFGLLHGGASCVLAETLGSFAAMVNAGPDRIPVGIEINATHHRAARSGLVTGVCTPLYLGRAVATFDIVITDADGRRICTARLTCAFTPARRFGGDSATN